MRSPRITATVLLALAFVLLTGCEPVTKSPQASSAQTPAAPAPPAAANTSSVTVQPVRQPVLPPAFAAPRADGRKLLLMHYMPWYETPDVRTQWGSHWTGHRKQHNPDALKPNGLPDIWSHYHPLIGPYDSTDAAVLECQLLQMRLAGVDGVIADWYGISDAADYPPIHDATVALFEATRRLNMGFSVCYEDRTIDLLVKWDRLEEDQVTDHLTEMVQWVDDHWFNADHHVTYQGRPLLLNFGPIFVKDGRPWQTALRSISNPPFFMALHHLWKGIGADGGFVWVHHRPWENHDDPEAIKRDLTAVFQHYSSNPDLLLASAFPGFRDVYDHPMKTLDHRGGRTMTETIEHAMDGPWPMVQLVTWNDYGEGTIIEPTHEFGYRFLEIIQAARRAEVGPSFPFTSDDLRLPAQLLELRRSKQHDTAELDRIAFLLRDGHTADASRALDHLAP